MVRATRQGAIQRAQQQGVDHRKEALSETEGLAVDGDQRLAGGQRTRSGSGLPQGHHRQQAYDAGEMVAASTTREPRNARSDMAVSRQVTTPSINGRDAASWMRSGHSTIASPTPINAQPKRMMFRQRVDSSSSTPVLVAVVASVGVMVMPPLSMVWSLAGAAGMPANLGSDRVTSHHHMM
jgi:hypothetical protein